MSINSSTTRARGGNRGRHVLIILVSSLVLTMGGWYGAESYGAYIGGQPLQMGMSR